MLTNEDERPEYEMRKGAELPVEEKNCHPKKMFVLDHFEGQRLQQFTSGHGEQMDRHIVFC